MPAFLYSLALADGKRDSRGFGMVWLKIISLKPSVVWRLIDVFEFLIGFQIAGIELSLPIRD